jgi:hypothetical protein
MELLLRSFDYLALKEGTPRFEEAKDDNIHLRRYLEKV